MKCEAKFNECKNPAKYAVNDELFQTCKINLCQEHFDVYCQFVTHVELLPDD